MADLQMVVTVTNFNFTEELKDTASAAYRRFEEHFRKEVTMGVGWGWGVDLSLRGHRVPSVVAHPSPCWLCRSRRSMGTSPATRA